MSNMRFDRFYLCILMLALSIPSQVMAERVPLSPEGLKAEATHVVTGRVKAVYSLDKLTALYGEGTIETEYLSVIEVQTIEKGEGLKPGDLVYARSWKVKKPGVKGTPGPYGHSIIPAEGARIRAFLAYGNYEPLDKKDGGWTVVYPNGIEVLEKSEREAQLPMIESGFSAHWWTLLIGFAGGIVVVLLAQGIFIKKSSQNSKKP